MLGWEMTRRADGMQIGLFKLLDVFQGASRFLEEMRKGKFTWKGHGYR